MTDAYNKIIELHFPVKGDTLPSDHSYPLYSAISNLIPEVHGAPWLGIFSIKGRKLRPGAIKISQFTKLRLRLPMSQASDIYKLAGAKVDIGGHSVQFGIPELHMLRPAKRLRSRFVMIKCKDSKGKSAEIDSFLASLKKQVAELGVFAEISLEPNQFSTSEEDVFARRAMRIKSATITGFGVILENLSEQDSLLVQAAGLGGKRRMGCGLFEPISKDD